jgi:hypothetical protein
MLSFYRIICFDKSKIPFAIHATKQTYNGGFTYIHVYGHMDQHLSWLQLNLLQQLNCVWDTLAKKAVTNAITNGHIEGPTQICRGKMLLLLSGVTRSQATYLDPFASTQANQWLKSITFNKVRRGNGLQSNSKRLIGNTSTCPSNPRPIIIKIWQSKQALGFCGTRVQVGLYSGEPYPDKRCPNCRARETNVHLMCFPDKDRNRLLIKNVAELEKWIETDGCMDPELIYWIPKYILMRNNKTFSHMGHMSAKMRAHAESQDKIGWRNFMEGYISCHFYNI